MNNGLERIWKDADMSNLRYYPGICLEKLRKATEILSHDSRYPDRYLKLGPPVCETGVLTTRPRRSVWH